jgi:hypothetical protein
MGYISNPNLNFVGTMDNRFYLESVWIIFLKIFIISNKWHLCLP